MPTPSENIGLLKISCTGVLMLFLRKMLRELEKDNSPLNMNILRKTALSLLHQAKYGRLSKKRMRFKASLNPEVLFAVLLSRKK